MSPGADPPGADARVPIRGELDGVQPVVLVDNGNSTGIRAALDALAREIDRLVIVRGQGNVGFLKGCTLGARQGGALS